MQLWTIEEKEEIRNVCKWPMDMGRWKVENQVLKSLIAAWLLYLHRITVLPNSLGRVHLEPVFTVIYLGRNIQPHQAVNLTGFFFYLFIFLFFRVYLLLTERERDRE